MKHTILILILFSSMIAETQESIHEFSFKTISGDDQSFADFSGKKLLIVNTASECGFTPQYQELQKIHEKYGDKVVVIGFPANNFGGQEPGTNDNILSFCEKNYGVTFLLASKISVTGNDIHPIFKWLCSQENNSFVGPVKWNFEKFLLDESGKLIARFRSEIKPNAKKITDIITKD